MYEPDRPHIIQSEDQPLAIEIRLRYHEQVEHRGRDRLGQAGPPGTSAPDFRQARRIIIQKATVPDHSWDSPRTSAAPARDARAAERQSRRVRAGRVTITQTQ